MQTTTCSQVLQRDVCKANMSHGQMRIPAIPMARPTSASLRAGASLVPAAPYSLGRDPSASGTKANALRYRKGAKAGCLSVGMSNADCSHSTVLIRTAEASKMRGPVLCGSKAQVCTMLVAY